MLGCREANIQAKMSTQQMQRLVAAAIGDDTISLFPQLTNNVAEDAYKRASLCELPSK